MKQRRAASLLLIVAMLVSVLTPGLGNVFAQAPPGISIVGRIVESADGALDNEFFELSLKVEPGTEGFLSAGAVLEYDTSLLQLVDWSGNIIDLSQSTNWIKAMPVPAVGPTQLTGRRAMAYQDAEEGVTKGYISLAAEAPQSMALTEEMQNVINVRFRYTDDAAREQILKDYGIQPSVTPEVTESPLPSLESTEKPAAVEEGLGPEGTISPQPMVTVAPGADFAAEKVFTFAPDAIAAASEINQSVWYQGDDENTVYYYTTVSPAEDSLGAHYGVLLGDRPAFTLTKGESVNTGGGMTLDQVQVLQFYDWDEAFLGARAISASSSNTEVAGVVESFAKLNYDGEYKVDNSTHEDRYVENDEKVLTNKKGYNFGGWVEVTPQTLDTTFTAYGTEEEISAAVKDFKTEKLNVSGGAAYIKAAYVGNEKLDTGVTGFSAKYYTYSDFQYKKMDNNTFVAEFIVRRENSAIQGVTRLIKPVIRLEVNLGSTKIYTMATMTGADEQLVQIVLPRIAQNGVGQCSITIVENGTIGYLSADPSSDTGNLFSFASSTLPQINGQGYVVEGTVTDVNNTMHSVMQSIENNKNPTIWVSVNYNLFTDMNLNEAVMAQDAVLSSPTSANFSGVARNKIMFYWVANGKKNLTYSEMLAAINMKTGANVESPAATKILAYLKPAIEKIQAESINNHDGSMTADELEMFINSPAFLS